MKSNNLTKKQATAVLVTIYHELTTIFESFDRFKALKDKNERRNRILEDLRHIIINDLKFENLENGEVYDLFKI